MRSFNVQERNLVIRSNYLLEASAGTGKTYSIQNIVLRLLIEGEEPFTLREILIVTFTRAATKDLKQRIRNTLEDTLKIFLQFIDQKVVEDLVPDYIKSILESDDKFILKAKKRIEQALFTFEEAQIFTIHGFCARMLKQHAMECDFGVKSQANEKPLSYLEIRERIRDYLRTEVREDAYSPEQIAIILKEDPDHKKLIKAVQKGCEFPSVPIFRESCERFFEVMKVLKNQFKPTSQTLIEDFQIQAKNYKNDKSGETKAESLRKIQLFAALFDRESWNKQDLDLLIKEGLTWVEALNPKLIKKTAVSEGVLHHSGFTEALNRLLKPVLTEAREFPYLLARLADGCLRHLRRYKFEEEKTEPDDLLMMMSNALQQGKFQEKIRNHYRAAIIDEFQDTDHLQWSIFQTLFLPSDETWNGHIYLVGDPKQSIYSFRQADIYTYLSAAKKIGEENCYSLNTNYRSNAKLVDALNTLFSTEQLPGFMPLPKQAVDLVYRPVAASISEEELFHDNKGAVHFFIAEEEESSKLQEIEEKKFFPFIANEIAQHVKDCKFLYGDFAVLVKDRFQATRLTNYLDALQIPHCNQRGTSLGGSLAFTAFVELLNALLFPEKLSFVKTFLAGPLLKWLPEQLLDLDLIASVMVCVYELRSSLLEKPFATFVQDLFNSHFGIKDKTLKESLLMETEGLDFYRDFMQLSHIIITEKDKLWKCPNDLIAFLDELKTWEENDDVRLKRWQDPEKNGVKILTLHSSKGLEFNIVFALGLINPTSSAGEFYLSKENEKQVLKPIVDRSEELDKHLEEVDAEKMRQLYVAMTRAKTRLYIPALQSPKGAIEYGTASPIDLFLARLGKDKKSYFQVYECINSREFTLIDWIKTIGKDHYITYHLLDDSIEVCRNRNEEPFPVLVQPKIVIQEATPLFMTSFSGLHSKSSPSLFELTPPQDLFAPNKTQHTLPANAETGLLLHSILENIDFHPFKALKTEAEACEIVGKFLEESWQPWLPIIGTMLFNVLRTQLEVESAFTLSDLLPSKLYKEMPFVFPYQGNKIEGTTFEKGMINGVVDLIFMHNEKYYILDWKSNWLGPSSEDYQIPSLHRSMKENHYFLQGQLYTEALKRYLKLVDKRPFEEIFGGCYYLFLRGMEIDKKTGIFHFFPEEVGK